MEKFKLKLEENEKKIIKVLEAVSSSKQFKKLWKIY